VSTNSKFGAMGVCQMYMMIVHIAIYWWCFIHINCVFKVQNAELTFSTAIADIVTYSVERTTHLTASPSGYRHIRDT
jgi:hypothetical protein